MSSRPIDLTMNSHTGKEAPNIPPQRKEKSRHRSSRQPGTSSAPLRISAACRGCRLKKQKCSGKRPECLQCRKAMRECEWPEQLKRGPSKEYIRALEARLLETEEALLKVLPAISVSRLEDILAESEEMTESQEFSSRTGRRLFPEQRKKFGSEYWNNFPLRSADEVRKWHFDQSDTSAPEAPGGLLNPIYEHEKRPEYSPQREFNGSQNRYSQDLPKTTTGFFSLEDKQISQRPSTIGNQEPLNDAFHNRAIISNEVETEANDAAGVAGQKAATDVSIASDGQIQVPSEGLIDSVEPNLSEQQRQLWIAADEEAEYLW